MSVLKWIWGLVKKLFFALDYLVRYVLQLLSSLLTWIIAGLAWLVHLIFQYVGGFFNDLFANLEDISIPGLQSNTFAIWMARDLLALDVAWECVAIFFSVWVASRIARASFAAVRAILDII